MRQATGARPHQHIPRITLNTDGKRHPIENGLAVFTLIAGIVAFPVGFFASQHMLASWAGIASLAVGLYAQMISATRNERVIIVTGLVAGFVGVALGIAHGGFVP
jgi:hypothetical protein